MSTSVEVMTEREAADYVKVSRKRLSNARVYGGGPDFVKLGRSVRYERESLDRWIVAGRRQSDAIRA